MKPFGAIRSHSSGGAIIDSKDDHFFAQRLVSSRELAPKLEASEVFVAT